MPSLMLASGAIGLISCLAMPLFNPKTLTAALASSTRQPTDPELQAAADWAQRAVDGFGGQNESQLEQEFNRLIVQGVLGFTARAGDAAGTMAVKLPVGPGIVDVALGRFSSAEARIAAPFELKGPKVALDAIMPGRAKTPVQQAWDYANDAVGASWVLVSNMRFLRLYAIGHGRQNYEEFDLARLNDPDAVRHLQLVLHSDNLLSGATADLLARSAAEDRDITDSLYRDYRQLRDDLLLFVRHERPAIDAEARIAVVQKLLDRLIFIAFAEDTVLIPDDSIRRAVTFEDPYEPRPKWLTVRRLFDAVDKGSAGLNIPPYNGGLFAPDPVLDGLDLPDELVVRFADLSRYDYKSQVSVTILGHIFEQSISDIEALQAEARGEEPPKTGTRKRFGVVYTPEFVTRFIVERTIGAHLDEARAALLAEHANGTTPEGDIRWRTKTSELAYWRAYLDRLTALRVVDPACGSGAFLIAAFDFLKAEQDRVRSRLGELEPGLLVHAAANADVEIITGNLFGVDVNAESVEITKLALWLKTAKRGRALESLDDNIRVGNSLIESGDFHSRAFEWKREFPKILGDPDAGGVGEGGFDIVLGNPPYVRMELLKPIKPYLEKRYEVVSDRADLYAYFFELGVRLLKPGGRLGYISSSTFFRTGSGAPLRRFLGDKAALEAVVDFGDLQIFEGVTTYPAILTLRKGTGGEANLRFLNVKSIPQDLGKVFEAQAEAMPQARLTAGSWRFEGDRLTAIRTKMTEGRKTLAEVYGPPLRGIVTGLNEAFVLDRATRDALIAADAKSADLLKPFLIGENLKRWHVESDDLWLIYTPKNRVDINDYPAVRDWLLPFRDRLEARATKQNWWELQQAQAAYERRFAHPKIIYPEMSQGPKFCLDRSGSYLSNKVFFIPAGHPELQGFLGSKVSWLFLFGEASPLRGGMWRLELREQYVSRVPLPSTNGGWSELGLVAERLQKCADDLEILRERVKNRLGDLSPVVPTLPAFRSWPDLDFSSLRSRLLKHCKTDIPVAERD
ncbi:MAG: N-6 DNA methylase, partial [Alphaproteobacteria bacterium]|nr:N-6 DNA methylase [Alphaproteobacteria bacterium]